MRRRRFRPPKFWWLILALPALALGAVLARGYGGQGVTPGWVPPFAPDPLAPKANARTPTERIVEAAKAEARRAPMYDARYVSIAYPGGDVPAERGACTDVVIRALRGAGYDLQQLVHEDMRRRFSAYPKRYGLRRPDPNIDHRRTPNLVVFLQRHAETLSTGTTGTARESWQPGDLVFCRLPNGMGHCGVVTGPRGPSGLPMVVHNMSTARLEDCLADWEITDHFRYPTTRQR
jgi:uncharacterized protein YijF (DUF1287 family)